MKKQLYDKDDMLDKTVTRIDRDWWCNLVIQFEDSFIVLFSHSSSDEIGIRAGAYHEEYPEGALDAGLITSQQRVEIERELVRRRKELDVARDIRSLQVLAERYPDEVRRILNG